MQTEMNNQQYNQPPYYIPKTTKVIPTPITVILIILAAMLALYVFNKSEMFDLMVVSARWGQPMVYKEHLQSGAIWDFTPRSARYFSAYPLGGDPEEDEFYVMRTNNNQLVLPSDVQDGYFYVYKRDEIEAEALRIAYEAGFEDADKIKVEVYGQPSLSVQNFNKQTSLDECISKSADFLSVRYFTYGKNSFTDDELRKRFNEITSQWDAYGHKLDIISFVVYDEKKDFDKPDWFSTPYGTKRIFITRSAPKYEIRIGE